MTIGSPGYVYSGPGYVADLAAAGNLTQQSYVSAGGSADTFDRVYGNGVGSYNNPVVVDSKSESSFSSLKGALDSIVGTLGSDINNLISAFNGNFDSSHDNAIQTQLDQLKGAIESSTEMNHEYDLQAMEFNAKQAQINRDFQMEMSNTAHQREVKDLLAAGLNPVLSANSGASTPTGSSASGSNTSSGVIGSVFGSIINSAANMANKLVDRQNLLDQLKAQTANLQLQLASEESIARGYNVASMYSADKSLQAAGTSAAAMRYSSDTSAAASRYASDVSQSNAQRVALQNTLDRMSRERLAQEDRNFQAWQNELHPKNVYDATASAGRVGGDALSKVMLTLLNNPPTATHESSYLGY